MIKRDWRSARSNLCLSTTLCFIYFPNDVVDQCLIDDTVTGHVLDHALRYGCLTYQANRQRPSAESVSIGRRSKGWDTLIARIAMPPIGREHDVHSQAPEA